MHYQVNIGDKYGHLTVLKEDLRGKHGERRYLCQCDCGNIGSFDAQNIIRNPDHRCRKCTPHSGGKPKPNIVGQTINGWDVISEEGYVGNVWRFKCRCLRCGNESTKSVSELNVSKSYRCAKCPPMYDFKIDGTSAVGVLPNGDSFIVDSVDIPLVEQYYWWADKEGYIISKRTGVRLHRLIIGVEDPKVIVDHINHDRKDCRRGNLRIISPFGNSANHSLFQTNKTGYTGVYYSKCSGRYEVKIGYNNKRIKLGSSKDDLITLAQMYNIGASFFFGEYAGALNDVPTPSDELVRTVTAKCKKYMKAPAPASAFVA